MIPVNEPVLSEEAKRNVIDCLNTGWISSAGAYIDSFERNFAAYIGANHAISTTNGTTALHLALSILGIGPGDEVIVPDLTIISCAFAVMYLGATPIFVDVDRQTGTLDPQQLKAAISSKTKAIMVVHLYGHPADMDPIIEIANSRQIPLVEDAAEAHGALYKGRKVGNLGTIGCFSFYANKLITTGEGGMIVTDNPELATKARLHKNLSHSPKLRFWHEEIGYNFRMTNLQAALGVGELEHIDEYLLKKRTMASTYNQLLADIPYLILPTEASWATSSYWMYALTVSADSPLDKATLRKQLLEHEIDTRDYFYPLHNQPVVKRITKQRNSSFPVATDLANRGFYLPSGLSLHQDQQETVSRVLHQLFKL
jgi:perosamine synthetase